MTRLRCVILLLFATTLALGQTTDQSKSPSLRTQPDALVRSLYTEVVARHPHDIPEGADMKIFAPYLSKALLHRIDLAKACSDDWDRQNPEPQFKEEMVAGYGLFTGEEAEPWAFQIERTQSEKDGSLRVYVNLTWEKPPQRPWTWRVAAVVLRENGHYVIDDVIYINDNIYDKPEDRPADRRLSEYLSAGCSGPRWAGDSLPDQPVALVRRLYQQVVARPPVGMLSGEDGKIFAPYLSKALVHQIDFNIACEEDWHRQYPDPDMKPPVLEMGLFSGNDEKTEPRTFHIERTESDKDGSFRIYVRLANGTPHTSSWWDWKVAAILVRENGRLVEDGKIFAPYLSKALVHQIDFNIACEEDWHRQYPDPDMKPPVLEMGLFSGNDEKTEPRTFHIERTESDKDGSFRIYVRLANGTPHTSSWWDWKVAAILVRENGRLVVDDVIFLKDEKDKFGVDYRLSGSLSDGCDGPRWVGYPDENAK